ncbi:unnamed protein product [Vitrella brassicaformis CCMP3155]|uniref:Sushi domain-containing protein n=1 Tax=Vitrella brassicaformis (strain CCMP3155) TaxID=1169540 RepID=A0A0G4FYF6_VITBC|nr:unnamed protein product [Vitrella brassicaformis CCMP3155]|eukprot:CEM20390.1 unnamed protein product [Vitrella brassicaformis CCMP3155]
MDEILTICFVFFGAPALTTILYPINRQEQWPDCYEGYEGYEDDEGVESRCCRGIAGIYCKGEGKKTDDPPASVPVTCEAPVLRNTKASLLNSTVTGEWVPVPDEGGLPPSSAFSYTVGMQVAYECVQGYRSDHPITAVCTKEGIFEYDEKDECVPISCPSSDTHNQPHRRQTGHSYHVGDVVTFSCAEGTLNGPSDITCEPSGMWSSDPTDITCTAISCDAIDLNATRGRRQSLQQIAPLSSEGGLWTLTAAAWREAPVSDEASEEDKAITDAGVLRQFMQLKLEGYNEQCKGAGMDLVLFRDAIEHCCRIHRVISLPKGNALLVGVGGSRRHSMTRLASFIWESDFFEIEISKKYRHMEFQEDLKKLYHTAGVKGKATTFLFSDTEIVTELFIEDVNNLLGSGEVTSLFVADELSAVRAELEKPAKQRCLMAEPLYDFLLSRVRENLHVVICISLPPSSAFIYTVGMQVAYECVQGYRSDHPITAVCTKEGIFEYDEKDECVPISCPSSDTHNQPHRRQTGHSYHVGDVVTFSCAEGTLNGPSDITCEPSGMWSSDPTDITCTAISCDAIDLNATRGRRQSLQQIAPLSSEGGLWTLTAAAWREAPVSDEASEEDKAVQIIMKGPLHNDFGINQVTLVGSGRPPLMLVSGVTDQDGGPIFASFSPPLSSEGGLFWTLTAAAWREAPVSDEASEEDKAVQIIMKGPLHNDFGINQVSSGASAGVDSLSYMAAMAGSEDKAALTSLSAVTKRRLRLINQQYAKFDQHVVLGERWNVLKKAVSLYGTEEARSEALYEHAADTIEALTAVSERTGSTLATLSAKLQQATDMQKAAPPFKDLRLDYDAISSFGEVFAVTDNDKAMHATSSWSNGTIATATSSSGEQAHTPMAAVDGKQETYSASAGLPSAAPLPAPVDLTIDLSQPRRLSEALDYAAVDYAVVEGRTDRQVDLRRRLRECARRQGLNVSLRCRQLVRTKLGLDNEEASRLLQQAGQDKSVSRIPSPTPPHEDTQEADKSPHVSPAAVRTRGVSRWRVFHNLYTHKELSGDGAGEGVWEQAPEDTDAGQGDGAGQDRHVDGQVTDESIVVEEEPVNADDDDLEEPSEAPAADQGDHSPSGPPINGPEQDQEAVSPQDEAADEQPDTAGKAETAIEADGGAVGD